MDDSCWVLSCVDQLKKIRPDMDTNDAVRIARSAWARTCGQTPEQAAEFFAPERMLPSESVSEVRVLR